MATIKAANSDAVILIDDEDLERVGQHRWYVEGRGKYVYATVANKNVFLHRFIVNETDPAIEVDHVDRNSLNCQKENLRRGTRTENAKNKQAGKNNKTGFRGVFLNQRTKLYQA